MVFHLPHQQVFVGGCPLCLFYILAVPNTIVVVSLLLRRDIICFHFFLSCLVVPLVLVHLRLEGVGFNSQAQVVYLAHVGDSFLLNHPGLPLIHS